MLGSIVKSLHTFHTTPSLRPKTIGEFWVCPKCKKIWIAGWNPIGRLEWLPYGDRMGR